LVAFRQLSGFTDRLSVIASEARRFTPLPAIASKARRFICFVVTASEARRSTPQSVIANKVRRPDFIYSGLTLSLYQSELHRKKIKSSQVEHLQRREPGELFHVKQFSTPEELILAA